MKEADINNNFNKSKKEDILLYSFIFNSFNYLLVWFPLFLLYKLYKKYNKHFTKEGIIKSFMVLYTFGKKHDNVLLENVNNKSEELVLPSILTNDHIENDQLKLKDIFNFLFCFTGLQLSFLIWGLMQERIIKYSYVSETLQESSNFKNSQFLVLCNRLAGFGFSSILIIICNIRRRIFRCSLNKLASLNEIAPLFVCSYSSLSNVFSSWFQYEALKYVSFTTQLLAKSSKSVFVMLVGRIVSKKKYQTIDYICVSIIAVGLYLFSDIEENLKKSKSAIISTTLPGIICLLSYLLCDSFTSTWQDNLLQKYKTSSVALMCITNIYSCMFTLVSLIQQNQLFDSINFMLQYNLFAYHVILLSLTSAIGQLFIFVTIEKYGALVFTLIMTTRQVLSIILSCIFYNHQLNYRNIIGTGLIFIALFMQQSYKFFNKTKKTKQHLRI